MSRQLQFAEGNDIEPDPVAAATVAAPPEGITASSRFASAFAGDLRTIFLGTLRVAELAAIAITGIFSFWWRKGDFDFSVSDWWHIGIMCLIATNIFHFAGLYTLSRPRSYGLHFGRVAGAWAVVVLIMISEIYFTKAAGEVSRAWILGWAVSTPFVLIALRLVSWMLLRRWKKQGIFISNVAVVGDIARHEPLARRIEEAARGDIQIIGVFSPRPGAAADGTRGIDDLVRLARSTRVDEIVLALPCGDMLTFDAALRALLAIPADMKLCLDPTGSLLGISPDRVPTVLWSQRPLAGWRMASKRCMDVVVAAALLAFFTPLMFLIAILVKLDSPGPVIFRQQRYGFNRRPITVLKFRTMYCDAARDPTIPQARRDDPRVTRLGAFLRRSSLDELPQLLNVLAGHMSLVGPRPHAILHDEKYAELVDGYLARHRVKPGITGWAQVNGFRGETNTIEKMKARVQHDLFYIEHWSPLFDLYILVRTVCVGFRQENAY